VGEGFAQALKVRMTDVPLGGDGGGDPHVIVHVSGTPTGQGGFTFFDPEPVFRRAGGPVFRYGLLQDTAPALLIPALRRGLVHAEGVSSDSPGPAGLDGLDDEGPVGVIYARDRVDDRARRVAPADALTRLGVAGQEVECGHVAAKFVGLGPKRELLRCLRSSQGNKR
jgi:hypothetical protein